MIDNKKRPLWIGILTVMAVIAAFIFADRSDAGEKVMLKVYQGYSFADKKIVKSGDKKADLSFYVNSGRQNALSFALAAFGAKSIKEFGEKKPEAKDFDPQTVKGWKSYANAPSQGWYGVLGSDESTFYLVKVLSFKNQGKAPSFWELTFTWEKL